LSFATYGDSQLAWHIENEAERGKKYRLTKLLFPFAIYSADDLILEENEDVLLALKRLSPKEAYDRVYRLRRAIQCSVTHKLLPKDQWTKPEDVRIHIYILPSTHPSADYRINAEKKKKRESIPNTCHINSTRIEKRISLLTQTDVANTGCSILKPYPGPGRGR